MGWGETLVSNSHREGRTSYQSEFPPAGGRKKEERVAGRRSEGGAGGRKKEEQKKERVAERRNNDRVARFLEKQHTKFRKKSAKFTIYFFHFSMPVKK